MTTPALSARPPVDPDDLASFGVFPPERPASLRHAAWIARCLGRGDLAPLGEDDVAELAAELGEQRYAAGTVLFRMGEAPARVHIVRSGMVELSRTLQGRKAVLQILRPGDVVGDVPLIVRMPEPYDARALADSLVLAIDSVTLFSLLDRRPRLARRWLVSVALRAADTQGRLVDLLAGGLEAQVAAVLVRQEDHGFVHLSQGVLAELVGGRRTSVNRVLKRLERDGLVRVHYGQVEVLDPVALASLAGLGPFPGR